MELHDKASVGRKAVAVIVADVLSWDHINLTGDYVWSDNLAIGADGFMPLRQVAQ